VLELLSLPAAQLCGVGDTDPDLAFLRLPSIGLAAAPANATPAVRAAASYVASAADGDGLLQIVAEVERRNRALN
jgi:hydroxymethylpyrimidine pyrophosphatase-like HAD family hydrolase